MKELSFEGRAILAEMRRTRYVQLAVEYNDNAGWHAAVKRTEAAFDGVNTSIYQMSSDEMPMTVRLSAEAFDRLVVGRLRYLIDQGMAQHLPDLEGVLTAYLQARELQEAETAGVLGDTAVAYPF